jgi:hercynylcysteine S-oxide lyase
MYVAPHLHGLITHPVVSEYSGPSRPNEWRKGFNWIGTYDMSSLLCVKVALTFRQQLGGEDKIIEYNHKLAVDGGNLIAKIWGPGAWVLKGVEGDELTGGDKLITSLVNVKIPDHWSGVVKGGETFMNNVLKKLMDEENMSCIVYKHGKSWFARFSAQVYVDISDFEKVGRCMVKILNHSIPKL